MRSCPKCFQILGNSNRSRIIDLLQTSERKVTDLTERLSVRQPTVSHHLAQLKKKGMVVSRKKGREIFYSLNRKYPCQECNIFRAFRV